MKEQRREVAGGRGVIRRGILLTTATSFAVGFGALGWFAGKDSDAMLEKYASKQDQNNNNGEDLSPNSTRRIVYKK